MTHESLLHFPVVVGRALDGTVHTLPRDFAGRLHLVFIAFKQHQQADVDGWLTALAPLRQRHPDLEVYELPTLPAFNRLFQWYIDRGMRSGLPDPAVRARTITLYLDKEAFRHALGLSDENTIYVLLLDRDGQVRWRTEGPFAEAKMRLLERAIVPDHEGVYS